MTPQALWARAQERWGGLLIGYRLRADFPTRWFRIHSLPKSKRYPTTPAETTLLLERHHTLLDWAFAGQSRLVLSSIEQERTWPAEREALLGPRDLVDSRRDGDGTHWRSFFSIRGSQAATSDAVLLGIANDELDCITFGDFDFATVVAPYDGGVDLFFTDPSRLAAARARFGAWRSSRPDGL